MAVLSPPLDPYNRPPEELAGYSSTSVEDGGETGTGNRPADNFRVSLRAKASSYLVLEEFPSAETDIGDDAHYEIDFSRAEGAYMSGAVIDDDGCQGEIRLKYKRPSDSTWRYLDGISGPALPMSVIGDIEGQIVALEADAKAKVWCKPVCIGGADTESPKIGNFAVHAGPMPPVITGLWDFNPTEGSGSTITDKRGSGLSMTTSAAWQAGDKLRYDNTGVFNFTHSYCDSDLFTLAPRSTMVLYFEAPVGFVVGTTGGTLCRRRGTALFPSFLDHRISVDSANGKFHVAIRTNPGGTPNDTDAAVESTTVISASGKYVVGFTHDGTDLTIWVNGVAEASTPCTDAMMIDTPTYIIAGGGGKPFSDQTPIEDMLLGRFVLANRALTAEEMATLYQQYKTQYPGLP